MAGTNLDISATATSYLGTVNTVEFYRDAVKIGESASAPYSCIWSNVPSGAYALTAKAVDSTGATGVSSVVHVLITASGNRESIPQQMKITFAGYTNRTEALTNFPVLVVFSNNVDNSGFHYGYFVKADGTDLRFGVDARPPTNSLPYGTGSWDPNGVSYVWVQVPVIPANGTGAIWVNWGNTAASNRLACTTNGAVWANGCVGVWHMNQTNAVDSTANRCNGAANNNADTAGQIGGGQSFNGSSAYVNLGNSAAFPSGIAPRSLSAWAKTSGTIGSRWIAAL